MFEEAFARIGAALDQLAKIAAEALRGISVIFSPAFQDIQHKYIRMIVMESPVSGRVKHLALYGSTKRIRKKNQKRALAAWEKQNL